MFIVYNAIMNKLWTRNEIIVNFYNAANEIENKLYKIYKKVIGMITVKNKFFTDKFVLMPQFAGTGSMGDLHENVIK